jgi:hypothetical protein
METSVAVTTESHKRWSVVSEINWGRIDIDAGQADAELLMLVRRAALGAARRTVALSHLLAALAQDYVASALLARELHDCWKHFHALRSYLEIVEYSPAIADPELDQHRRTASNGSPGPGETAGTLIAGLLDDAARDRAMFALISARASDPALARLADRIGADRHAHSLGLERLLAVSPDVARVRSA